MRFRPPRAVVYVSQTFPVGQRPEGGIDTEPIASEFLEYLKGRYDYKSSVNYPTGCAHSQARGELKSKAEQAGQKVVELEWDYAPDPATAGVGPQGDAKVSRDYGWCFSPGASGTVYAAGPFQIKGRVAEYEWNRAFGKFLADKYAFKAGGTCAVGTTLAWAQRRVKLHTQGARAGDRKVVETGWAWDDATASSPAAKPADDDREPAAPPPPPPPPSAQARDFATKEISEVMAICNNDKMLSGAFDCSLVSRAVSNYRMAHAGDATPEPVEQLFTGDKLDCSACLIEYRASVWAASRAQSNGFQLAPAQCVGKRFAESLKAKPYPNRVKEAYDAAVTACKR